MDFVTTKGNVDKIVTPLCIFKMVDGSLQLESIHSTSSLKEVIENTQFEVVYDEIKITPDPTEKELKILNTFDKNDYRNIEF